MALLCGLVPTAALAANEYEIPNIIEYKAMTLVDLQGGKWVSRYQYAKSENTFFGDVNLNVPSLLRIGFIVPVSDEQALDADMEMGEPVETLGLDVSTDEAVELPEDADLADDVHHLHDL